MGINIVTYPGQTRTAKHDAIVYDAALDRSGIFNGCDVTASGSELQVSVGYGIIKGRVFEVTADRFQLSLPGSGTTYGALIITLDLSSSTPLSLETITSSTPGFKLTKDENANFSNGRYQMLIATYLLTTSGIQDITKVAHMLPMDSIGSTDFNDYIEPGVYYINDLSKYAHVPVTISNGWLEVHDSRYKNGNAEAIKQIFYSAGSTSDVNYRTYIRTRLNGVWKDWVYLVADKDLYEIDHNVMFGDPKTAHDQMVSFNSSYRRFGCLVSSSSNAGLYDIANNAWILRSDKDQSVHIPHELHVGKFSPKNIEVGDPLSNTSFGVAVRNKYRNVGYTASLNENVGLFDNDKETWILRNDKNRVTYFSAGRVQFDYAIAAPQSIIRGTIGITPTAVNTPVYKDVSWKEMGGIPVVVATPTTSVPEKVHVSVADVTKNGCRIYLTRTDGVGVTGVQFIAIYTF